MTHRSMSLLMILTSIFALLATELDKFPASWHPYIVIGSAILLAVSQSVQNVVTGEKS